MGFAHKAKWQDLTLNNNLVCEPTRNNNLIRPTIPTDEKEFTKFNFDLYSSDRHSLPCQRLLS